MNARLELVHNNAPYPVSALHAVEPSAPIAPAVMRMLDWPSVTVRANAC